MRVLGKLGHQKTAGRSDEHGRYHEIVYVHQSSEPEAQIAVVEQIWPPLMLGSMMFCRAGVAVTGGAAHVVKDVAESQRLRCRTA